MQSVPIIRPSNAQPREVRSQEMQPITDMHFVSVDSEIQEVPATEAESTEARPGPSNRYTRSGSITANYYGDESVNVGQSQEVKRQVSAGDNKKSHQSRRLPYWIWVVLAKSLGIKLTPDDKPIFGTLMHVLTLLFALGFTVTFTWHKVYDIVSEYTKETVLRGSVSILMTIYWCALGVYANQLAGRLFRNPKFLDSVRLHSKTIFKISAAGIMICLGITVTILQCIDTAYTYKAPHCQRVSVHPMVCRVMYVMKVGCAWISLLWNLLVGIVLLSVCRTHTIGIRRFIRELEIDGRLYELSLRQGSDRRPIRQDPNLEHEALWDDDKDLWVNISTDEEILSDSSEVVHSTPTATRSCPTSPLAVRAIRRLTESNIPRVSHSLPRDQELTQRKSSGHFKDLLDQSGANNNNPGESIGDKAISDYFKRTSDESVEPPTGDLLVIEDNHYEKEENPLIDEDSGTSREGASNNTTSPRTVEGGQGSKSNADDADSSSTDTSSIRLLSVDDIYLSFWKISCRLRFTSIALQRWLIGVIMFIILWSFTYIIYWVKHEATMMDITMFLIPILILPIVCSAYGEVNYEGKRMLRCICPTSERTEMLQTLFQQPLELNAFGFAISYQVIGGALGALAVAFCTRLVLDEISS